MPPSPTYCLARRQYVRNASADARTHISPIMISVTRRSVVTRVMQALFLVRSAHARSVSAPSQTPREAAHTPALRALLHSFPAVRAARTAHASCKTTQDRPDGPPAPPPVKVKPHAQIADSLGGHKPTRVFIIRAVCVGMDGGTSQARIKMGPSVIIRGKWPR